MNKSIRINKRILITRGYVTIKNRGIGRHTVPPRTSKTRTTNLKTKNNQN